MVRGRKIGPIEKLVECKNGRNQKCLDAKVGECRLGAPLPAGGGSPRVNSYYLHCPRWIALLHDGFQFEFQTLFSSRLH